MGSLSEPSRRCPRHSSPPCPLATAVRQQIATDHRSCPLSSRRGLDGRDQLPRGVLGIFNPRNCRQIALVDRLDHLPESDTRPSWPLSMLPDPSAPPATALCMFAKGSSPSAPCSPASLWKSLFSRSCMITRSSSSWLMPPKKKLHRCSLTIPSDLIHGDHLELLRQCFLKAPLVAASCS